MKSLIGVVLCGGQSSRMGSDKGLLRMGNKSWAEIIYSKLSLFPIPVYVSINSLQRSEYATKFASEQLIEDAADVNGPLKGIMSVHQKYPDKDLLVCSCDMPLMTVSTLFGLYDEYLADNLGFDYFAYQLNGAFEPLCTIYTSSGLKKVLVEIQMGNLLSYSIQNILKKGKTKIVGLPAGFENSFVNCNYPEDLQSIVKKISCNEII